MLERTTCAPSVRAPRLRQAVLVALFVLALPQNSRPSPSREALPDPPTLEELRMLEGLASWVAAGSEHQPSLHRTWSRALRQNRAGFELFAGYHDPVQSADIVAGLRFGSLIVDAAVTHGLDPLLVAAVVETESGFRPQEVSPRGAVGLMQVMPANAPAGADLADPRVNVDLGCSLLAQYLARYAGDVELALAAYNAGPYSVSRFGGVPPYAETRRFVERVLGTYVAHQRKLWAATGAVALFEVR